MRARLSVKVACSSTASSWSIRCCSNSIQLPDTAALGPTKQHESKQVLRESDLQTLRLDDQCQFVRQIEPYNECSAATG